MSFVLPRNAPKLTFSGSVPSLEPRPKPSPAPSSTGDVYAVEAIATPYVGSRPHVRAARPIFESYDDAAVTLAIDRERLGGAQAQQPAAPKRSALPVFRLDRTFEPAAPVLVVPGRATAPERTQRKRAMTLLWVVAAVLAAMASYKYAPEALDALRDAFV